MSNKEDDSINKTTDYFYEKMKKGYNKFLKIYNIIQNIYFFIFINLEISLFYALVCGILILEKRNTKKELN